MAACIFCENTLDSTTKTEHILLNALGGRKTTKRAICSSCNNNFGSSIDKEFAAQSEIVRSFLQLESGTGNPAPKLRNIETSKAGKINIKGDGSFEAIGKPFRAEILPDGNFKVEIRASSDEHLARMIPDIAASLKIDEENFKSQIANANVTIVEQPVGVIQHSLSFGGPEAIRSMVKSALVLWSTKVGNAEIKNNCFDEARRFVQNGDLEFNINRTSLDFRFLDQVDQIKLGYDCFFNLLYLKSDENGRVVGHFTLYNLIGWQFVLANSGGSPNRKIALISNPLNPSKWSDTFAEEFDVPFIWFENPDQNYMLYKSRFEVLAKYKFENSRRKENERIIYECFREFVISEGDALPEEKFAEFSERVASRLTISIFGLPFKKEMDQSIWNKILKGKQ